MGESNSLIRPSRQKPQCADSQQPPPRGNLASSSKPACLNLQESVRNTDQTSRPAYIGAAANGRIKLQTSSLGDRARCLMGIKPTPLDACSGSGTIRPVSSQPSRARKGETARKGFIHLTVPGSLGGTFETALVDEFPAPGGRKSIHQSCLGGSVALKQMLDHRSEFQC